MRIVVALQAIAFEGGQHRFRMRLGMAVAALGHGRVFVLVAEGASQLAVFGGALAEHGQDIAMAGAAVFGGSVRRIADVERAVRLMAFQAILVDHEIGMRLMASQALVDRLMFGRMAEGTVLLRMFAGVGLELLTLGAMAGETGGNGDRGVVHGYIQRRVGIAMAAEAVLQFEMSLGRIVMAHAALGNGLLAQGQMLEVAAATADLVSMFAAVGLDVGWLLVVAFEAIGILQFRRQLFGLEGFLVLIGGVRGPRFTPLVGLHARLGAGATPKSEARNGEDRGTKYHASISRASLSHFSLLYIGYMFRKD